ncbi:hypothetical protein GJR96_02515 [Haloferax sp. MBLA0076]|uniref:Uncharacterized protein n=1 Tax=Haloferax litoreum TaxID=2666140 RepID=A0A6A8GFA4_9EURY|nr:MULTISPECIES: hypothetical protein [Haloferax]KAB1192372.1 hypothetical protein Hfx1148_02500 [Haloferax sp. CBA1148]MRX20837.1 hypothetical protein [Haloferax litoreum]
MELTFNITEAGTESVDIEHGGAETIPEPPREERSTEMAVGHGTPERQEMGRMAEPTVPEGGSGSDIPTVAPPMEYRATGTAESIGSESAVVAPPSQFRR